MRSRRFRRTQGVICKVALSSSLHSTGRGRGSRWLWPTTAPASWARGSRVGGSGCRGEGGDRKGGPTGGGGQWEAPVFEEGEAWSAGGSVSKRGRRSGCRPATASGGGGVGRPRGAQGGVSLLRRCSHASESRTNRRRAWLHGVGMRRHGAQERKARGGGGWSA
jgi:hypothetical protein